MIPSRTIIQFQRESVPVDDGYRHRTTVLCDDGTVWVWEYNGRDMVWKELSSYPPGCAPSTANQE